VGRSALSSPDSKELGPDVRSPKEEESL